jgi:hypothetical protein
MMQTVGLVKHKIHIIIVDFFCTYHKALFSTPWLLAQVSPNEGPGGVCEYGHTSGHELLFGEESWREGLLLGVHNFWSKNGYNIITWYNMV